MSATHRREDDHGAVNSGEIYDEQPAFNGERNDKHLKPRKYNKSCKDTHIPQRERGRIEKQLQTLPSFQRSDTSTTEIVPGNPISHSNVGPLSACHTCTHMCAGMTCVGASSTDEQFVYKLVLTNKILSNAHAQSGLQKTSTEDARADALTSEATTS